MNKEDSIRFAGLMEYYLHIPSFVCEMIEKQLEENKYKEVVEYIIQRRNEIENKEDYVSQQQAINMWIDKLQEKDKAIEILKEDLETLEKLNDANYKSFIDANNIINELEKYLKEENKFDEYKDITYRETMGYVLDKLKELKEGK